MRQQAGPFRPAVNAVNVCNSVCLFERPFRSNLSYFSNSETRLPPPPRATEEVTQIFLQMVLKLMACHFDLYGQAQIQAVNS